MKISDFEEKLRELHKGPSSNLRMARRGSIKEVILKNLTDPPNYPNEEDRLICQRSLMMFYDIMEVVEKHDRDFNLDENITKLFEAPISMLVTGRTLEASLIGFMIEGLLKVVAISIIRAEKGEGDVVGIKSEHFEQIADALESVINSAMEPDKTEGGHASVH